MPSWRNMPSMPKVRASSGMIGTTRGPTFLSRTSCVRQRTNACVVEISRPSAVASSTGANASSAGAAIFSSAVRRRCGRKPPSARRRSCRYFISGEPASGLKNGTSSSLSSGTGMAKRSRNSRIAAVSSFFSWCVGFLPSPTLPMPKPFTVFARITVGRSSTFIAAAKAA